MKIRKDYITNSSSSNFMIGRKDDLTEDQKNKIIDFVKKRFLGKKIASTEQEWIKYLIEERYGDIVDDDGNIDEYSDDYDLYKEGMDILNKGLNIYSDWVSFEDADWTIGNIYQSLFNLLNEDENFKIIDDDLSY